MNKIAPLLFVALLLVFEIPGQAGMPDQVGHDEGRVGNDIDRHPRPDRGSQAIRPLAMERLPDLNTPRAGCVVALGPDGMPVVFGGHTTGFVRTATAEYFANGAWHEVEMLYPHDNAFCVPLRSGEVLIGGGHF